MATIDELKSQIDLHDLADKLGLERPGGSGNYRSPHHADRAPSLSVFDGGRRWRDHSMDAGGSCVDLVMHVEGCDVATAVRRLHELYGLPTETPRPGPRAPKSRAEYVADRCFGNTDPAREYLAGRGITEAVVERALAKRAVGFNDWHSDKVTPGEFGHGGPAVAFIVRSLNPGTVVAVDMRYLDPALNGGVKTQTQGDKAGHCWFVDLAAVKAAPTVVVVESPINALSVESAGIKGMAAVAVRGLNTEAIDWSFLAGKRVLLCFDNDEPQPHNHNRCPGQEASWALQERLIGMNIAAHLIDQGEWECNDINDLLQEGGVDSVRSALRRLEPWIIPGVPGRSDERRGRARVFLPPHDLVQYWRFRCQEDFTTLVKTVRDADGNEHDEHKDLCGFRVAAISRVTVAGATSTMSGEPDTQPRTMFAVSIQVARHGNRLIRRVFEDERLHNLDHWGKFGPIFIRAGFLRMISILERSAHIGARDAINFVGLAWKRGRVVVNEGPDCYFTDPEKQCPYHNLTFPSGSVAQARAVWAAYSANFRESAASLLLVWALGCHFKAYLGFWPHMMMQADKGAGKSTLIKWLERSIGFTMFSGQSLQTEFRLLTSISHTSHPVGWEEISARRQDVIDKAVSLLQETYQYTITRRGSEMTEYLLSAPVLLAGEDVPVKSLTGKLVSTDLTGRQGGLMPEDLPRFPVKQWLDHAAGLSRSDVMAVYRKAQAFCRERSRASGSDTGATRMVGNYAAILTAWHFLSKFMGTESTEFETDLIRRMNTHIAETSGDREPWVWITEAIINELSSGNYRHPSAWVRLGDEDCLCLRTSHVIHHLAHTMSLRETWNAMPVKSARVYKRQLRNAGVLASEDIERTINGRREAHMVAISLPRLEEYGLHASVPEDVPLG